MSDTNNVDPYAFLRSAYEEGYTDATRHCGNGVGPAAAAALRWAAAVLQQEAETRSGPGTQNVSSYRLRHLADKALTQ